ncbi:hypothetical protein BLOT_015697 [Blomia tropicalis]|nr:hypothetical protein BLOT_015697 [Blomia tropicalis]
MSVEEEKTRGSGSGTFGGSNSSIASLSFKAPKFDKKYVKMWLELVEAGFITSNYTRPKRSISFFHSLSSSIIYLHLSPGFTNSGPFLPSIAIIFTNHPA